MCNCICQSSNLNDSTVPLAVRCWLSYGQFNISNLTCGADHLLFAPITVHFSGYGIKDPQGQVDRWLEILSEYDFKVQHYPGVKHGKADPLSQHYPGVKHGKADPLSRLPCK